MRLPAAALCRLLLDFPRQPPPSRPLRRALARARRRPLLLPIARSDPSRPKQTPDDRRPVMTPDALRPAASFPVCRAVAPPPPSPSVRACRPGCGVCGAAAYPSFRSPRGSRACILPRGCLSTYLIRCHRPLRPPSPPRASPKPHRLLWHTSSSSSLLPHWPPPRLPRSLLAALLPWGSGWVGAAAYSPIFRSHWHHRISSG
jgi:hypothetical protein